MDKTRMIEAMISHYTKGNKARFASLLGVSAQTISAWVARSTFDSELIYTKCSDISADWLLTGEGSMLKEDAPPSRGAESASSDTVILRLMDKLDQKESRIDQLQSELRLMSEELATFKAKYPEATADHPKVLGPAKDASTKRPSSPNADNVTSATAP